MNVTEVTMSAALVVVPAVLLIMTGRTRHRERVTRRWLRDLGENDADVFTRAGTVLMARERSIAAGMLGGTFVGLLVSIPLWGQLDEASSPLFSVSLAWAAGAVLGSAVRAVSEGRHAHPPAGARVALSTPIRLRWLVSRVGLLGLGAAAVLQMANGVLKVNQVRDFDGGWSISTLLATSAMILLSVVVTGSVVLLAWLVRQPFFASNAAALRIEIALRRDQFKAVARMVFPMIVYVGFVVGGIDDSSLPFLVRSGSSGLFFRLSTLTLLFAVAGSMLALFPRDSAMRNLHITPRTIAPAPVADQVR